MIATSYEALVDPTTGVITYIDRSEPFPGDPTSYVAMQCTVARTNVVDPWLADPVAMGTSFTSAEHARHAAIGEAVERYCGNFVPGNALRRASYNSLVREGTAALDPDEIVLYTDAQYDDRRLGIRRMTGDLAQLWTPARDYLTDDEVLVPGSLVWVNWYDGPRADEPRTNYPWLAGIAAGRSVGEAIEAAATELIERDAIEVWWRGGLPAREVTELGEEWDRARSGMSQDLDVQVLAVPTRFHLPVIVVVLHDRRGEFSVLGSACRLDASAAAGKALAEAVHLRRMFWDFCDPHGVHWTSVSHGLVVPEIGKQFRPQRDYLDSFAADFVDVLDLSHQALVHLDRRHADRWRTELADRVSPESPISLEYLAARQPSAIDAIRNDQRRILYRDLTTDDVRSCGLHVVRVIVPGMIPNAPAGIAHLGSDRYVSDAADLGVTRISGPPLRSPVPHV